MRIIHGTCLAMAVLLLLACQPAAAQVRPIQGGNALDANPLAGSGGYNAVRPVTSGINSNLIVTGNVTGGRAFQGFSPIQNPTALQIAVPSATLSTFVRDSVGLPAIQAGLSTYAPRPYFAPSRTAVTAGTVQNQALLPRQVSGTYRVGQYQTEMPVTPLTGTRGLGQILPELPSAAPTWQPSGIGMFRPDIVDVQPDEIRGDPLSAIPLAAPAEVSSVQPRPARPGPRQTEPGQVALPPESPLTQLIRPQPMDRNAQPDLQAVQPSVAAARPAEREAYGPAATIDQAASPGGPEDARLADSSLLTAMQRYTLAIQKAISPAETTGAQEAARLPGSELLLADSSLREDQRARLRAELQRDQATRLLDARLANPIRTLAGERRTPVDQMLAQAEQLMQQGEYYRASQVYNALLAMTPDNPLAWLGRANALLAAGEYRSAYLALEQGVQQYPDILLFDYDLPALVGNREVLDIRRAEIERTLAVNPDYRLRFLLGYLEYFSGLRDLGLQTLQQAAAAAPAGSIVPRAHQILASRTRQAPATQPAP